MNRRMMAETIETLLYGPPRLAKPRAKRWSISDFRDVDDRVRGGSSQSKMTVVSSKSKEKMDPMEEGEIIFDGFLDTTTLGGAGFASQLCSTGFPWVVRKDTFKGLALRFRRPSVTEALSEKGQPGGAKGPVTCYCVQLKMEVPEDRPDGRRESVITYEWEFDAEKDGEQASAGQGKIVKVQADWDSFKPTYRGRPKPDAEPLDPEKVKEWSVMARSNFGSQSGPFSLQIATLSAIHSSSSFPSSVPLSASPLGQPAERSSGEYYGFALFIFATVTWVAWILWALLPDSALEWLGIGWYPNREWAYLLPAWSLVAVLFTYISFVALNIYNTPSPDELQTITDSHANVLPRRGALAGMRLAETGQEDGPLAAGIYDLPLGMVSRALYLDDSNQEEARARL